MSHSAHISEHADNAAESSVRWTSQQTLRPDWEPVHTDDGETYYWNTITDETTWDPPIINQRVLIRSSPASAEDPLLKRCSPGDKSFLNWRAEDTQSPRHRRHFRCRGVQAEHAQHREKPTQPSKPDLCAQTKHTILHTPPSKVAYPNCGSISSARAKFSHVDANTREEIAIRRRAGGKALENDAHQRHDPCVQLFSVLAPLIGCLHDFFRHMSTSNPPPVNTPPNLSVPKLDTAEVGARRKFRSKRESPRRHELGLLHDNHSPLSDRSASRWADGRADR
mmetsp:Transcript_1497/g.3597  ORF Transcript_1497/g.3597 Transcript_1497/m.3597 type:complete len:280 (-) Transcript_1497:64-903(-)